MLPREAFFSKRNPFSLVKPPVGSPPSSSLHILPAYRSSCQASASMRAVVGYLRSRFKAGTVVPDATYPGLDTFLVIA